MTEEKLLALEVAIVNKKFITEETNREYWFLPPIKRVIGESLSVVIANTVTDRVVGMETLYLHYIDDKVKVYLDNTYYTLTNFDDSEGLIKLELHHSDEHILHLSEVQ